MSARKLPIPFDEQVIIDAVEGRAQERDLPLGRAAVSLIADALLEASLTRTITNLEEASTEDLVDELVGRLAQIGEGEAAQAQLDAAIARAEAAEGQLATIRTVLEQVRPQA